MKNFYKENSCKKMSYLRFDKTLMTNLKETLPREILRTNRSGAYHCTTIVDCNTRKYHGLLVIPIPELDDENHVLLSSLDATVIQHGAEFNLGLHKFRGDNYSPRGHKYIREYECEKVPTTWYRVGGVILKKETLFEHYENRILIRYTLVDAHSATTLRFRPFLAFRSVRQYTHENSAASREYQLVDNGIKTCMYPGYPDLYMQFNKKNEFIFQPDWYRGMEYPKEQERGYDSNEDLYVPGYFEMQIKKGESIVFAAGVKEVKTRGLKKTFEEEMDERTPRDNFQHCLVNAAHQFTNRQGGEAYILAGYPWFKCRARDMFISLPGLTLAIDEQFKYDEVMLTACKALRCFMNGEPNDLKVTEMEHPDVLLWAVWCIQQFAKMVSKEECAEKYGALLKEIMEYICQEKHPNLFLHGNGLLYTNGHDKAVTWMNSTANGRPVIPRTGYVVEVNALWYNALRFVADVIGEGSFSDTLNELAEKAGASFVETFLNEHGYLLDYVDGRMMDWSVRPNMIFAAAFDYSPLNTRQKKGIVDICSRELLTPKGLRSLSPKSGGYNPNYVGPQNQRDYAYHQGTAWPWLAGFYFEAYLKIYKMSALGFIERHMIGIEDEMTSHCIGSLPELFDGNPPFKGRGAVSFAMNVAEILRTLYLLNKYNY
jgi:predicted glycogen debranching enzyme